MIAFTTVSNDVRLRRAIRRVVRAEVRYSWVGSIQDSEERTDIIKELKLAKSNLSKIIAQVVL